MLHLRGRVRSCLLINRYRHMLYVDFLRAAGNFETIFIKCLPTKTRLLINVTV